ncbi:MAG: glycosyltransferase family 4 protein [Pseudanabaenaceae cyanobacterium bins.68]|nr:glycosyltransferase family 4 protein [Pseudanabaenaceae cyanobacterium bins.68]
MKILVLAWEFPPRIVGGISRHVAGLYPELVKLGYQITLVTIAWDNAPEQEVVNGIEVHRVPVPHNPNFFAWVESMNYHMQQYLQAQDRLSQFHLIHGHDWLVSDVAIDLAKFSQIPLIATIHATEYGRSHGIHTDANRHVHDKEIAFSQAADRVIVCSKYMRGEVERALQCPDTKVDVVYNGLTPNRVCLDPDFDPKQWRSQYANPDQKIVYYVGRITYEKGIFVLLNAAPQILAATQDQVKFVIIGSGDSYTNLLKQQAWDLGISHQVIFTGFMSDQDLGKFQLIADCAVFPSLYEPFGIVALEGFAANVPVVVSNTGGLPEVVIDQVTGVVVRVNDAAALAQGILQVLEDVDYAQKLVQAANIDLKQRFSWQAIAHQTSQVYAQVLKKN